VGQAEANRTKRLNIEKIQFFEIIMNFILDLNACQL
jgi:hypothetical protein